MTTRTGAADAFARRPSERVRLARAARETTLRVPGVRDTDAGPLGLHLTADAGERLEGITCVATREGGYEVSIRLVADLVALPALTLRVQAGVRRAARTAGVPLSAVSVHVADLR